jgi:hypothetical protein
MTSECSYYQHPYFDVPLCLVNQEKMQLRILSPSHLLDFSGIEKLAISQPDEDNCLPFLTFLNSTDSVLL